MNKNDVKTVNITLHKVLKKIRLNTTFDKNRIIYCHAHFSALLRLLLPPKYLIP